MRPLGRITARLVPLALFLLSASVHAADVVEYYHTDGIGNVRVVTDATGAVIERHDYLPFGEEWCGTAVCGANRTPGQPLRFTGKERDAETGLDYFGARYYRANAGRFTTVDPARESQDPRNPQSWNRYAYSLNNPLRYIDPTGESPTLITAVAGIGIGGALGFVGSVVTQAIQNGGDLSQTNWGQVGAATLGGAIAGGAAGLTLGVSYVAQGGIAAVITVNAGANALGGVAARAADGDAKTRPIDGKEIGFDLAFGAVGGAVGLRVQAKAAANASGLRLMASAALESGETQVSRELRRDAATALKRGDILANVAGARTTNAVLPAGREAIDKARKRN